MTDYISRADAICEVLVNDGIDNIVDRINALPSADAVSREDYEDIIKDYRKQYENMNNEIADLEAKLSADAVQGEWLYVENEPYSECSKCGRYIDDLDEDKYAYCPYCGARMKGGAE